MQLEKAFMLIWLPRIAEVLDENHEFKIFTNPLIAINKENKTAACSLFSIRNLAIKSCDKDAGTSLNVSS